MADGQGRVEAPERSWARTASLLAILIGMGSVGLAAGAIGPLLVPVSASIGDEKLAQILVVLPMLGLAVGGLIAGWIAQRLKAKGSLIGGALVYIGAGLAAYFAPGAPVLLAACFTVGLAAALVKVGAALLLAQLYEGQARARVIGLALAFGGLMATGAVYLSGVLSDLAGWRTALLQFVAGGGLVLAISLLAERGGAAAAAEGAAERPRLVQLVPPAPMFLAVFLVMLLGVSTGTHVPLMLAEKGVRLFATTSTVLSVQPMFSMLLALAYGPLQARVGRLSLAVVSVLMVAAGCVVIATAETPVAFGVGCALMGSSTGLMLPYLMEGLYARAPLAVRGYALGVYGTLSYLGAFAAPFVLRPIRELAGFDGLYVVLAIAAVAVGGAYRLSGLRRPRAAPVAAASIPET